MKPLSQDIRGIVANFGVEGGVIALHKATLHHWRQQLRSLPLAERTERTIELIAVALRFRQQGSIATRAVAQLLALAVDLRAAARP
jgi:hypothetical protein